MKVVLLAGGFGTRISEESAYKPKPLVEIGGQPILWHIMKYYSHFGFDDFVVCAGYKQNCIKEYFANYYLDHCDVTFDMKNNKTSFFDSGSEPWTVSVIDTGLNTMTGGRLKRVQKYLDDEPFMLTYGDGVSDVDLNQLLDFHRNSRKTVTLTAIMPGGRFGALNIGHEGTIQKFREKKKSDGGWINGGFMVMEPEIFDFIDGDDTTLEKEPFDRLTELGELAAYKHHGFWQCMDSVKDKALLEDLIARNEAPWIIW